MKATLALALAALPFGPALAAPYTFTALPSGFGAVAINNVGQIAGLAPAPGVGGLQPAILSGGMLTFPLGANGLMTVVSGINDNGDLLLSDFRGRSYFVSVNGNPAANFTVSSPANTPSGTTVRGLNDARQVVGYAQVQGATGATTEGFVANSSGYTLLPAFDPAGTEPNAINNRGDIVGGLGPGPGVRVGFLLQGGTYTTVAVPGALVTLPFGINDGGEIVGQYEDPQFIFHGFTLIGGTYSDIVLPDGAVFLPAGVDNGGDVLGSSVNGTQSYLAAPAATTVPEPASLALLGVGVLVAGFLGTRRASRR